MSQFYINSPGGTPTVPTSFVTDSGTAIPAANILNVIGGDGIATSGGGNTVTITLDNIVNGTALTVGALTDDAITFAMGATPAVYQVEAVIAGFDVANSKGIGYTLINAVRTTGAAAVLCGTTDKTVNEEAALSPASADIIVSGNTFIVRVLGVAATTIKWVAQIKYIYVEA